MTYTIPYGTSEPADFQLRDDGADLDGTGLTVTLEIETRAGDAVVSPPTVAWLTQASGTVRVSGIEGLAVGTYLVRYKLTDSSSDYGYCPNGHAPDVWRIVPVLT